MVEILYILHIFDIIFGFLRLQDESLPWLIDWGGCPLHWPPVVFLNFQGLSCGFPALNFLIICFSLHSSRDSYFLYQNILSAYLVLYFDTFSGVLRLEFLVLIKFFASFLMMLMDSADILKKRSVLSSSYFWGHKLSAYNRC